MSMPRVLLCLSLSVAGAATADEIAGPGLGQPVARSLLNQWNGDVFPDGQGLPPGRGNALEGETIYREHCQTCHGFEGKGGSAEELAGSEHSLTDDPPDKTIGTYWPYATTVFDFTRRSMPLSAPGTLSDDQLYAVTAYLLYLNGIIGADDEMSAATLPLVEMPNRNGFIDMSRQTE